MSIVAYYDIRSKYTSDTYAEFGGVTERHRKLASYFSGMVPKEYPVLDIGCADGGLLQALKLEGYQDLCGLEAAVDNVRRAQQEYHLDVHEGALGGTPVQLHRVNSVLLSWKWFWSIYFLCQRQWSFVRHICSRAG